MVHPPNGTQYYGKTELMTARSKRQRGISGTGAAQKDSELLGTAWAVTPVILGTAQHICLGIQTPV